METLWRTPCDTGQHHMHFDGAYRLLDVFTSRHILYPLHRRRKRSWHNTARTGVATIGASFSVSAAWLKRLTAYSKQPKVAVQYFDTEDLALRETEMYITGDKAKLYKDTSYKGLWAVSSALKEF